MRGIYILGIVIILLIVIGVLFYYENIKFDINVIPYSLTCPIVSRISFVYGLNLAQNKQS